MASSLLVGTIKVDCPADKLGGSRASRLIYIFLKTPVSDIHLPKTAEDFYRILPFAFSSLPFDSILTYDITAESSAFCEIKAAVV